MMDKFETYLQAAKEKAKSLLEKFNGTEENGTIEDKKETLKKSENKRKQPVKKIRSVEQKRERKSRVENVQSGDVRSRRKSSGDNRIKNGRPANARPVSARSGKTSVKTNEQQRKEKPATHTAKKKTIEHTKTKLTWRTCLESIKNSVKRDFHPATIKKHPHLFIFPIVFVYFEIILRVCAGTSVFSHFIYPVLFGLSAGFLVTFITLLFRRPINRKISIVLFFLMGLIFTAECLVKRSFQWYLPISGILGGAGDVAGDYIGEAIKAMISGIPVMILFFLPGVLYWKLGQKYVPAKRFKPVKALRFLGYSAFLMFVAVLVANIGSSGEKYRAQYKFDTATEYFGLLTSLRLETKYSMFGNSSANKFVIDNEKETEPETEVKEIVYGKNEMEIDFSKVDPNNAELQELNTYVQSLKPSSQNAYTGLFEGKNLIMICAEAFSDVVIHKELTPTLYRMTHNGFYFSEFYQPAWGGSTTSGEYSFVMGVIPMDGGACTKNTAGKNLYFTMGNQMQRLDYTTYAYHSGTFDFYDRDLTHENLGYNQYLGMGNGIEELVGSVTDDTVLFDKTMDVYMTQQPFSVYYMSLSGHCIYDANNRFTNRYLDQVKSVLGDGYEDKVLYYYCYQMELENALTLMIEKLEAAGIADDTVICITSDHYPYGLENTATFDNDKDYLSALYGYVPEHEWEQDHNSWILWSGCLENEYKDMACEISEPTYSLDIVPTLSNLFGLEYDSRLMVGRDVFSDEEAIVVWNNYTWVTERGKYNARNGNFYPNEGYEYDADYVSRINNIVANKIAFSKKVIAQDYYGVLFGKDTVTESGMGKSALLKPKTETKVDETGTKESSKTTETE